MADCDFASSFGGIVVMPQGWLPRALAMRGPRHAGTGAPRRGWSSKLGTPTASNLTIIIYDQGFGFAEIW